MLRRTAALLTLPIAVAATFAQQPSPVTPPTSPSASASDSVTTISTIARQVVLDVVVTDKNGNAVKALKQSDITLKEDKIPQQLVQFSERDSDSEPAPAVPAAQLPPNTFEDHAPVTGEGPITAILFDELSFADAAYARDQLSAYMSSVSPGTPICIFKRDWQGLHLIQDFTTDPRVLRTAIDSERNQQIPNMPSYTMHSDPQMAAVQQLARYLSGFPGRKNLIWFTEGPSTAMLEGRIGDTFEDQYNVIENPQQIADVLSLSRVALYPVVARGVSPGSLVTGMALNDVAKPTGGKAFYDTNGLKQAVDDIIADGSNYYTLAYNPSNPNWDGKFRHITIELSRNALADADKYKPAYLPQPPFKLAYRDGYFARDSWARSLPRSGGKRKRLVYVPTRDPSGAKPVAESFRHSLSLGAVAPFQISFRAQVTPDTTIEKMKRHHKVEPARFMHAQWLGKPYRVFKVHFSVDPRGILLPTPDGKYSGVIDFAVLIYDDNGAVVNSRIDTAQVDLTPERYKQALAGRLGFSQYIAVPVQGNYFLRLGVHEWKTDLMGALEIPVADVQLEPASATAHLEKGSVEPGTSFFHR